MEKKITQKNGVKKKDKEKHKQVRGLKLRPIFKYEQMEKQIVRQIDRKIDRQKAKLMRPRYTISKIINEHNLNC